MVPQLPLDLDICDAGKHSAVLEPLCMQ